MADKISTTEAMLAEQAAASATGVAYDTSENLDVANEPGGYATLYDRRTGEPSIVRLFEGEKTLRNYLNKTDRETGERVFSLRKPDIERTAPTVPCWMNKLSTRFAEFAAIGQVVGNGCSKMLFNESDVRDHMENSHPGEYAAAERQRTAGREDMLAEAMVELARSRKE